MAHGVAAGRVVPVLVAERAENRVGLTPPVFCA